MHCLQMYAGIINLSILSSDLILKHVMHLVAITAGN